MADGVNGDAHIYQSDEPTAYEYARISVSTNAQNGQILILFGATPEELIEPELTGDPTAITIDFRVEGDKLLFSDYARLDALAGTADAGNEGKACEIPLSGSVLPTMKCGSSRTGFFFSWTPELGINYIGFGEEKFVLKTAKGPFSR